MRVLLVLWLSLGVAFAQQQAGVHIGQQASPYSNVVFPSQTFTGTGQTGTPIQLNGQVVPTTVGSSFASGTITLTGSALTTVTFAVYGSSDKGTTYYPLPISTVSSPGTAPASTVTATANGLYQVSLAGITHVEFVTSGTFTATSISLVLTATPNASVPWGGNSNSGGNSKPLVDTRPRATTSDVAVTVAAGASCLISVSPATAGQQAVGACLTSTTPVGPGTITYLHLTLGPSGDYANILQNSTLTFNCDGEVQTIPLGMFLLTQDNPLPFSNDWNANSLGRGAAGIFSANRRMEANFSSGCTVTFNNASSSSSTLLFGEVDYRLGPSVSRPTRAHWHAVTVPLRAVAQYANFQMLPTVTDASGGELESITLFGSSPTNPGYLEGYTTVTIDGVAAVQANGTEDFFGSGYYAVNTVGGHTSPKWGEFYSAGVGTFMGVSSSSLQTPLNTYDALLYRNFQTDDRENALFTNNLAVFQPNGEASKPGAIPTGIVNMESMVTFWSHDPMASAPTFSPAAGTISPGTTITMSSTTSGATNCYTTDGSIPTGNGVGVCTHGATGTSVLVSPSVTLNALVSKSGYMDSLVSTASYNNGSSGYTFSGTTFANNGATTGATATTPAVTLVAGDFVFMMCQGTGGVSLTPSSSPSATWNNLNAVNNGSVGNGQGFYISSASAGSTTFTCTASSSAYPYLQATVMIYHTSGASGTLIAGTDISAGSPCGTGLTCTSASFSTNVPALVIACGQVNTNADWTAGLIGSTTATLRASGSSGFTSTNPACEDAQFTTSQTGITSSISQSASSAAWNMVGAAFK